MARADFAYVNFSEHLGDSPNEFNSPSFKFVGNQTRIEDFTVDGTPVDRGYVIIQVYDVGSSLHKILINGTDLGGFDIPAVSARKQWSTWMDTIRPGLLKQGKNTIQITRESGEDNFIVREVIINWRREG